MARIREDLAGVVTAGSVTLRAGDVIPDGVHVGGHLTEDGLPANVPVAPVQEVVNAPVTNVYAPVDVEPLTEDENASAEDLGITTVDVHPERVRGTLVGYLDGWNAAVVELGKEQAPDDTADDGVIEGQGTLEAFNPADHNAVEVHAYLAEHPEEIPAVLALELAREKPRAGIVDKYNA